MKKISSRFSMAVHILSLASVSAAPCTSEYIAGSINTNPVVVRRITGYLKKAGLVEVRPGTGGTVLLKDADEITLLDIYRAVEAAGDGDLFHFHEHPNPDCPVGASIESALRARMREAQRAMEQKLAGVTLKQLIGEMNGKAEHS